MQQPAKISPARERLLQTASRLFFEKGYSEVGIDEIILEAGVAKATFYNHFPSKTKLVEAWLTSVHSISQERNESILVSQKSAGDKINAAFDILSEHLATWDYRGCPYSNSCAITTEGSSDILEIVASHKEGVREFFRNLCTDISPNVEGNQLLADQIFLLYSGATTEAQNLRSLWPVDVARQTALKLFACL